MSYYREILENYLHKLNIATETVYDVGGKDLPVKDRVNSWAVDNYKILDLPEYDFNNELDLTEEKADIVFCLELMEYIYNPIICMGNLSYLLKTGGILYITFPFVYPYHKPLEQDCLRYTRTGAIKLLEKAGFKIEEITERVAKVPEKLIDFYKSDGMHVGGDSIVTGFIIKAKKI